MGLKDEWIRGMLDRHRCSGADCYANTDLCKFESSPDSCNTILLCRLPTEGPLWLPMSPLGLAFDRYKQFFYLFLDQKYRKTVPLTNSKQLCSGALFS